MPLSPSDLVTLSRLLDEAMDLAPGQVDGWLAGLSAEHEHLRPRLEEMLAAHRESSHPGFMADGPKLEALDETVAREGEVVGPYRLIREIGRGGMGTVWLAERADGTLKRHIALKLPRLAWGAGLAERMARERDIGALLEHPNIARLYDAGVDAKGRPYLALEYIDGQPLDAWCEATALPIRDRLRLFVQVAKAVAYAHGRLVVHRDLKPSNVLVTADGQAHLLDFGIAKLLHEAGPGDDQLTQEQGRVLTPHYASPEQIRGETITVASDVYSLGVLLYELLTGRYPYEPQSKTLAAIEAAILNDEPVLASSRAKDKSTAKALRGEIDAILGKALKREPVQRYPTADALAEDVNRHLSGGAVLARPDSVGYRLSKTLRRHRVGFAAVGAVLLAVLGGAAVAMVQAKRASESAERARVVKEFVVDVFKVNERGNPGNAELRQLPAELLLERGAKLIETKFPGQPTLQAELFAVVGGIFADMGAYKAASDYASREIEALVAIGATSAEQSKALMRLATTLANQGRLADAEARSRRAIELAKGDARLLNEARLNLAEILFLGGKNSLAKDELDALTRAMASTTSSPSIVSARALFLKADLLVSGNQFQEAVPLYTKAIEDALRVEGRLSRFVIAMRMKFVHELIPELQIEEARPQLAEALAAMRSLGGADDIGAAIEESNAMRVMFNFGLVPADEALATVERTHAIIESQGRRVPEVIRARADFILGRVLLDWGHVERAYSLLSQAIPILRLNTESPAQLRIMSMAMGIAAQESGRSAQADTELKQYIDLLRFESGDHSSYMASGYATVSQNFRMQARYEEALSALRSEPTLGEKSEGDKWGAKQLASEYARIYLERGEPGVALSSLSKYEADEAFDPANGVGNPAVVRAVCWCALSRPAEGLQLMEKFTAVFAQYRYAYSPELAQMRALTAECAIASGQRKRAAELAQLAHAALVAQPGVSPYYKRQLERLDRLVRTDVVQR